MDDITFDDLIPQNQAGNDISFDDLIPQPEDRRDPVSGIPGGDVGAERLKAGYTKDLTAYGMGKADELPEPSTDMYDSFPKTPEGYKEALKLYNAYKSNEDAGIGGFTYKNKYIPAPDIQEFGQRDGSIVEDVTTGNIGLNTLTKPLINPVKSLTKGIGSENVLGGVNNAAKNLVLSAAAAIETVNDSMFDGKYETGFVKGIEENWPEWNAKGGMDEFVTTGTEVAVGAALGGSIGLSNKLLASIAIASGSALTVDDKTPTVITGENALAPILNGVSLSDDPSYAQQVLERKFNLIAEALVAEGVVNTTAKAAVMLGSLVKHAVITPLKNFTKAIKGDVKGIESLQIQQVLDALNIDVTDKNAVVKIRDALKGNKRVEMDLGIGGKETANINRTTMSTIQEVDQSTKLPMDLEAGQLQKGSPKLQKRIDQPIEEMADIQDAATREYGGVSSAREAGKEVANIGERDIQAARTQVEEVKKAFNQAEKSLVEVMSQNPELGETVKKLSDASGVQIFSNEAQTGAENVLIGKMKTAIESLTKKKNALYDAIPDDVEFDIASFSQAAKAADKYLPDNVRSLITPEVDFKTLHNKVVPELSRSISMLLSRTQVDENAVKALSNLRKNIYEDQLDYLINNGSPEVAQIAKEAKTFYKDVYAPLAKTDPLNVLFDIHDMTTPRVSFEQKTLDILNSQVKETKRFNAEKILDLLKTTEDPADTKALSDVIVGRTISKIRAKFSSQNLSDISSVDLVNTIRDEAGILSRDYPEIADSFNSLVKQIEVKKNDLAATKQLLDDYIEASRQLEQDMSKKAVGKFLNILPGSKKIVKDTDGYQVLSRDFFSDKKTGLSKVSELVDLAKAEDNPLILRGLKGGYFKHLQDGMFKENKFQAAQARELLDSESPFYKMGQKIFEDDPEMMDRIHDILVVGFNETVKRDKLNKVALINPNKFGTDASSAMNIVITQVFGVLNRLGARVRSGASAALKRFDPANAAAAIADEIFANPDYAIELLDREIANFEKGIFNPEISREAKLFILKALGRSGFVQGKEKGAELLGKGEEESFLQQWDTLEKKWIEEQRTNKQTDEIFKIEQ